MLEIVGNLLDNAYKWCRQRVRVTAGQGLVSSAESDQPRRSMLMLSVEDDGPGISPAYTSAVLQRGFRADMTTSGHGIGLSIVKDIVDVYGGSVEVSPSEWGGAKVTLYLRIQQ